MNRAEPRLPDRNWYTWARLRRAANAAVDGSLWEKNGCNELIFELRSDAAAVSSA